MNKFSRACQLLPSGPKRGGHMRISLGVLALTAVVLGGQTTLAQTRTYRTLNDTFAPPHFTSLDAWNQRAAHIRELILESAGLMPMPERTPLARAGVRRDQARRLQRIEGVLRKPAGVFCHGESLPSCRRGPVSGDSVAARALGVRPPRKLGDCLGAGARDQPRAPGLRRVHDRHGRLQRQLAASRIGCSAARARSCGA